MTEPQPPAWDWANSPDPWLPERLADATTIAAAELAVVEQVWADLSSWVVAVRRHILTTGTRPDLLGVYAETPRWAGAVRAVVDGPIRTTMGIAYHDLFGPTYDYGSRQAVVDHLSEVTNRLTRFPDTAFNLLAAEVTRGAELGESIPEIADRVDQVLDTTTTPRWRNRATVIARTETLSALNAGRSDAFVAVADVLDQPMEQQWLATIDHRTRSTHRRADGQRVPVGQPFLVGGHQLARPGDPNGPGSETIQCRCTMLLVEPGESLDLTHRQLVPTNTD